MLILARRFCPKFAPQICAPNGRPKGPQICAPNMCPKWSPKRPPNLCPKSVPQIFPISAPNLCPKFFQFLPQICAPNLFWGTDLGHKLEKFGLGHRFGAQIWGRNWKNLGHRFGAQIGKIWGTDFGRTLGGPFWAPNLGTEIWAPFLVTRNISGPKIVPSHKYFWASFRSQKYY